VAPRRVDLQPGQDFEDHREPAHSRRPDQVIQPTRNAGKSTKNREARKYISRGAEKGLFKLMIKKKKMEIYQSDRFDFNLGVMHLGFAPWDFREILIQRLR
jgi:hypothetical protein